jgi:hypothetical protein
MPLVDASPVALEQALTALEALARQRPHATTAAPTPA